jgi:hypothetical protein
MLLNVHPPAMTLNFLPAIKGELYKFFSLVQLGSLVGLVLLGGLAVLFLFFFKGKKK